MLFLVCAIFETVFIAFQILRLACYPLPSHSLKSTGLVSVSLKYISADLCNFTIFLNLKCVPMFRVSCYFIWISYQMTFIQKKKKSKYTGTLSCKI